MLTAVTAPIDLPRTTTLPRPATEQMTSTPATPKSSVTLRVPKMILGGTLMGTSELVRFAGFMMLLGSMGLEASARAVLSR